jgi:uncharacterized protein DUF3175
LKNAHIRHDAKKTTSLQLAWEAPADEPKEKKSRKNAGRAKSRRWSAEVTKHSDALDLQSHRIALSLKRSAERSKRRKGTPYQSAMSMLNFYINRAGKNLPQKQKRVLEREKNELRDVFGRT